MTDNDRVIIFVPNEGNYIEILGHRIDGFDSFESFCEHLKKFAEMEDTINRQKAEIDQLHNLVIAKHKEINRLDDYMQYAKAEAIKEFAERLKALKIKPEFPWDDFYVTETTIDNLVKEMAENNHEES